MSRYNPSEFVVSTNSTEGRGALFIYRTNRTEYGEWIFVKSSAATPPFRAPFKISQGAARETVDVLLVRIHTDEGSSE